MSLREKLFRYSPLDRALDALLSGARPTEVEEVPLADAVGRVSAEDLRAPWDVPRRPTSLFDGYAVSSADTSGASPDSPVRIRVTGEVRIGEDPGRLEPGCAFYVATDAYLPEGADSVIPVESVPREVGRIVVRSPVRPGRNVLQAGADVRAGQVVLRSGQLVEPRHLDLLADLGFHSVRVSRRPRVAIVPVGSELSYSPDPGRASGVKLEVRHAVVGEAVRRNGGDPLRMPIAPDDPDEIGEVLQQALSAADVVVTVGGTSIGRWDYVWTTLKSMDGFEPAFRGLRLKPGRVTSAAFVGGKPVVLLAGHYQSMIAGLVYVLLPLVRAMAGLPPEARVEVGRGRLRAPVGDERYAPFRRIVFARLEGEEVVPIKAPSFCRRPVVESDGFVEIPEGILRLEAGEEVVIYAGRGLWGGA